METRRPYGLCLLRLGNGLGFVTSLGFQRVDIYLSWLRHKYCHLAFQPEQLKMAIVAPSLGIVGSLPSQGMLVRTEDATARIV
jgi:hypothetical protein